MVTGNYELDDKKRKFENYFDFDHIVLNNTRILARKKKDDITIPDDMFELVHEPIKAKKMDFVLFGHIHEKQKVKKFGLNVGVDCHNFCPISLDDVLWYKNAIKLYYDDNVFC